jgi:uncharacterized protein involved in exopolysaccharide biosynthesis
MRKLESDFDDMEEAGEKETTLFDLFLSLWRYKKLIIAVSVSAMVIALALSIISLVLPPEESFLPNLFTPRANMLINNASSSGSGIAAALNASGLGGLASMAGVNVASGPTFSNLAIYLVNSDTLLDSVIERFDLVTRYKIEESIIANSRKALKEKLKAEYDDTSGVFTILFSDYDPVFACDVVNYCVDYLSNWFNSLGLDRNLQQKENLEKNINSAYEALRRLEDEIQTLERSATVLYGTTAPNVTREMRRINMELNAQQQIYSQLKVQLELTNTAIASETPIFQILETAQVPDLKSGPSRGRLCIFVTLGAFFFSLLLVFILTQIENIRNDSKAMEKFRALNAKKPKRSRK